MLRSSAAAALLLLLAAPLAAAEVEPIDAFEEPHKGTDKVWDVLVSSEEARKTHAAVFRNPIGSVFGIEIFDAKGERIWEFNGSRGVRSIPALEPGPYRVFVRGFGELQLASRVFGYTINESVVHETLHGSDVYVIQGQRKSVLIEGDVAVEWMPFVAPVVQLHAPVNLTTEELDAYIITIRGAEGAAYTITLADRPASATEHVHESPGAPVALALGVLLLVARLRPRR